jgi:putative methyltransferase (TIGR04325 family)
MRNRSAKDLLRPWIPPRISEFRGRSKRLRLDDAIESWDAAKRQSIGYQDPRIIRNVELAARRVLRGQAQFERDGVAFATADVNWPIATGLLLAAARNPGSLRVLDYGGSLGSQYFQCRGLLSALPHVNWTVVEQEALVSVGREMLTHPNLFFVEEHDHSVPWNASAVLFSSVLQYLDDPLAPLCRSVEAGADVVVIDRTPISRIAESLPTIQISSMSFGTTTYPAWVLGETALQEVLLPNYAEVSSFSCPPGPMTTEMGVPVEWRGGVYVRREGAG